MNKQVRPKDCPEKIWEKRSKNHALPSWWECLEMWQNELYESLGPNFFDSSYEKEITIEKYVSGPLEVFKREVLEAAGNREILFEDFDRITPYILKVETDEERWARTQRYLKAKKTRERNKKNNNKKKKAAALKAATKGLSKQEIQEILDEL